MPLNQDGSEIVSKLPTLIPTNDTDPSGGDNSGTVLNQSGIGVLIPTLPVPLITDPAVDYYYAHIVQNDHGSADLVGGRFWQSNGLLVPTTNSVLQFFFDSAAEVGVIRCTILVGGVWVVEPDADVSINVAVQPCTTIQVPDIGAPFVIQKFSLGGGAPSAATGNIFCFSDGVLRGYIPKGRSSAMSLCQMGMDDHFNLTLQADNRLTVPLLSDAVTPMTFAPAPTSLTGLTLPDGGDLAHGDFIKVWWKLTVPPGIPPPPTAWAPTLKVSGRSS